MKILVISAEYPPFFAGGIALNVFDMNNHMNKKNDVITLTFGNNNDTIISEEKETKVISFPIPVEKKELTYEQKYIVQNQNIIANIDKYENILVNASLIILHGYFMSKLALYISKRYNIPILYYLHVMYTEKIENLLDTISKDELKILKKAKGIVSVSGYLLEKANGIYPIMKKSIVIGKYVDIQNTFSIKSSENNKLYLYVGRMSEEKGIEILLYAFKKYIECNNQDAVLYCIGNFVDEEYENKIKNMQ